MDVDTTLGLAAGTLTTLAFIPQVIKAWKSRHTHDISLGMFVLFSGGVLLWLLYGIRIGATPIILSNSVTLVLALTILALKIRYK